MSKTTCIPDKHIALRMCMCSACSVYRGTERINESSVPGKFHTKSASQKHIIDQRLRRDDWKSQRRTKYRRVLRCDLRGALVCLVRRTLRSVHVEMQLGACECGYRELTRFRGIALADANAPYLYLLRSVPSLFDCMYSLDTSRHDLL